MTGEQLDDWKRGQMLDEALEILAAAWGRGPASGPWRDRAERSCRTGPGLARESLGGVKDGRADRISRVGQYPAHVRPGECGYWRRRVGGSAAYPAGSRTTVRQ